MQVKSKTNKKLIVTLIISLVLGIVAGLFTVKDFPYRIEMMIEDAFYQRPDSIPDDIKLIVIDEETLEKLGPYSDWDRGYFAELINVLNGESANRPKVIGLDVVFTGTNYSEGDKALVEVAAQYDNLVMGSTLTFDKYVYQNDNGDLYMRTYVAGEGKPYEDLARVCDYGFTNAIYEDDGYIRKVYTSILSDYEGENRVYDSFAYTVAKKAGCDIRYPSHIEIAFTGNPGDFERVSMSDVIDGTVPAEHFKDSIVLVGVYEESLMDSYRVPIDYSSEMYGVEINANAIYAMLYGNILYDLNHGLQFILTALVVFVFSMVALNIKSVIAIVISVFISVAGYFAVAAIIFSVKSTKSNILAVIAGVVLAYLIAMLYRYIEIQKRRIKEMNEMTFSMAEAMSEAIEGRTPYNANHTKNVAQRCVQMVDYINEQYKAGKTKLHFTDDDRGQIYLAAMLHDVGKLAIPLSVMDKPTKLGDKEDKVRDRLEIIGLRLQLDAINGVITEEDKSDKIAVINEFIHKLDRLNCGRPLNDEEKQLIEIISKLQYIDRDGNEIPYLTEEELEDISIRSGTLSNSERDIMQSHVEYTDKILSHMKFSDKYKDVRRIAGNHHELLNGSGYPDGLNEDELDVLTRILTIMDIYDSLIAEDRPYKKPKPIPVAFEILDEEAEAGKIDKEILGFAKELYQSGVEGL